MIIMEDRQEIRYRTIANRIYKRFVKKCKKSPEIIQAHIWNHNMCRKIYATTYEQKKIEKYLGEILSNKGYPKLQVRYKFNTVRITW